jgi:hypothetical protein
MIAGPLRANAVYPKIKLRHYLSDGGWLQGGSDGRSVAGKTAGY